VQLFRVTEAEKIAEHGVAATPAVIARRSRVKSVGRAPSVEVIKEWIKELRG
jgi:hypothetical protein